MRYNIGDKVEVVRSPEKVSQYRVGAVCEVIDAKQVRGELNVSTIMGPAASAPGEVRESVLVRACRRSKAGHSSRVRWFDVEDVKPYEDVPFVAELPPVEHKPKASKWPVGALVSVKEEYRILLDPVAPVYRISESRIFGGLQQYRVNGINERGIVPDPRWYAAYVFCDADPEVEVVGSGAHGDEVAAHRKALHEGSPNAADASEWRRLFGVAIGDKLNPSALVKHGVVYSNKEALTISSMQYAARESATDPEYVLITFEGVGGLMSVPAEHLVSIGKDALFMDGIANPSYPDDRRDIVGTLPEEASYQVAVFESECRVCHNKINYRAQDGFPVICASCSKKEAEDLKLPADPACPSEPGCNCVYCRGEREPSARVVLEDPRAAELLGLVAELADADPLAATLLAQAAEEGRVEWEPKFLGESDPEKLAPKLGAVDPASQDVELDLIPIEILGIPRGMNVHLTCEQFSTRCPVTGQPDYSTLLVSYTVSDHIVETKSFKIWLQKWYGVRVFNEAFVARLAREFFEAVHPLGVVVSGEFATRGGVSVKATCGFGATE
jgi:7-cyano-7-deazaguanine reductase